MKHAPNLGFIIDFRSFFEVTNSLETYFAIGALYFISYLRFHFFRRTLSSYRMHCYRSEILLHQFFFLLYIIQKVNHDIIILYDAAVVNLKNNYQLKK